MTTITDDRSIVVPQPRPKLPLERLPRNIRALAEREVQILEQTRASRDLRDRLISQRSTAAEADATAARDAILAGADLPASDNAAELDRQIEAATLATNGGLMALATVTVELDEALDAGKERARKSALDKADAAARKVNAILPDLEAALAEMRYLVDVAAWWENPQAGPHPEPARNRGVINIPGVRDNVEIGGLCRVLGEEATTIVESSIARLAVPKLERVAFEAADRASAIRTALVADGKASKVDDDPDFVAAIAEEREARAEIVRLGGSYR